MWPAAKSTARPSGSRHPVTSVFGSEPSGLSEKMRPPLRSSTNRRPLEERESVMFPPERRLQQACAHDSSALSIEVETIGTEWTFDRRMRSLNEPCANREPQWRMVQWRTAHALFNKA